MYIPPDNGYSLFFGGGVWLGDIIVELQLNVAAVIKSVVQCVVMSTI